MGKCTSRHLFRYEGYFVFTFFVTLANCVRRRKNASLYGFESIFYGTCRRWVDGSWDAHLASPADFFAGADDITKRESLRLRLAWDIERTL